MGDTEILNISPSDIAKGKFGKGAPEKNEGKKQGKRESYEERIPALAIHAEQLRQRLDDITQQGGELPFEEATRVRDAVFTLQQTIDKWGPSKRAEGSAERKERLLDDVSALYASVNQTLSDYGISAPPKEEDRHTKILQRAADSSAKLPAQDPSSSGLTPIYDEPAPTGDDSSDLIPQPDAAASGANLPEANAPDVDPLPEVEEPFDIRRTIYGEDIIELSEKHPELKKLIEEIREGKVPPLSKYARPLESEEDMESEKDGDTREPMRDPEACPTLDLLFAAFGCTGDTRDEDTLKARIKQIYVQNGSFPQQIKAVGAELKDDIGKLNNKLDVTDDEKQRHIEEAVRKLDELQDKHDKRGPVIEALNKRICNHTNELENLGERVEGNAQSIEDANKENEQKIQDVRDEVLNTAQQRIAAARQELERLAEEQNEAFDEERAETENKFKSYRNKSIIVGGLAAAVTGIVTYFAAVAGMNAKVQPVETKANGNKAAIEAVESAYKKADKDLAEKMEQADESLAQQIAQGDKDTLAKARTYTDERSDAAKQQAENNSNDYTDTKVTEVREYVTERTEQAEKNAKDEAREENERLATALRAHVTQKIDRIDTTKIDISDKLNFETQDEVIEFLGSDYFAELIRQYDENKDGGAFAKSKAQRSRTLIIKGMQGYSSEERKAVREYLDR